MAGRNTKLTPVLRRELVRLLRGGNYFETACKKCGITPKTAYNWLKTGEKSKSGDYREFYLAVETARAEAEIERVQRIRRAGKGGALIKRVSYTKKDGTDVVEETFSRPEWQADMTHLERQYFDRWGKKEKHEHTGKDGKPIEAEIDAKGKLLDALNRFTAGAGAAKGDKPADTTGG